MKEARKEGRETGREERGKERIMKEGRNDDEGWGKER
jgi:hypothetical protein